MQLDRALEAEPPPDLRRRRPGRAGGGPAGWPGGRARRRSGSAVRADDRHGRRARGAACASKSSWTALVRGAGGDACRSTRGRAAWRSAAASSGSSESGAPGSAAAASSRSAKWPARRSIVVASKRSAVVARGRRRARPPGRSTSRVRSNLARPARQLDGLEGEPRQARAPPSGAFWSAKRTWKSGVRREVALRAAAPRPASRTAGPGGRRRRGPSRRTRREQLAEGRVAREVGAQHQGVDEEADQPLDLAAGAVGDRRCRPRGRPGRCSGASRASKPASRAMNRVAPARRPGPARPRRAPAARRDRDARRRGASRTAGRGRSVGSSRTAGAPASCSRQ